MNTAEILRAAAAQVRQGWCQHSLDNEDGGVCAIGAIAVVTGLSREQWWPEEVKERVLYPATGAILRAIGSDSEPHLYDDIPNWNDGDGQTAENVARTLEYAALLWEQGQAAAGQPVATEPAGASA